jgi:hypothetical protein
MSGTNYWNRTTSGEKIMNDPKVKIPYSPEMGRAKQELYKRAHEELKQLFEEEAT